MTRDACSNAALEVHSRCTRVEPATGWRCRRRRTNDRGRRRERSPVSLSLRTPPAHCLMIGLITDTFDLISKQGWHQSHSRVLPISFSNSHCAPEHGPSASINRQCWQPSAQGRVPFSPFFISVLVTLSFHSPMSARSPLLSYAAVESLDSAPPHFIELWTT